MRFRIYPVSRQDRLLFWFGVISSLLAVVMTANREVFGAVFFTFTAVLNFVAVYGFRGKASGFESQEYLRMINQLTRMGSDLSKLSDFLEGQRKRVEDTENILSKLREEKAKLKPIVVGERAKVEAIIAAYLARSRHSAWKERLIGFSLGIMASFIAAYLYEFLRS